MSERNSNEPSRGEAGFTLLELLITVAVIGILAAIGASVAFHAFDSARASRTTASVRQVASVVMSYETSNSLLPGSPGLQPVASIIPALGVEGERLDPLDGWGNDLYYEVVTVGSSDTFRVYSYGKDGVSDGTITGTWVDFTTDIVIEGGLFLQGKW